MTTSPLSGDDAAQRRHEFMMQQHEIQLGRQRTRSAVLIGFLALVLLLSVLVLINPGIVGAEPRALHPELRFALVLYSAALLMSAAEIGLLIRSRNRAIETSLRLTQIAFDLGMALGRQKVR